MFVKAALFDGQCRFFMLIVVFDGVLPAYCFAKMSSSNKPAKTLIQGGK